MEQNYIDQYLKIELKLVNLYSKQEYSKLLDQIKDSKEELEVFSYAAILFFLSFCIDFFVIGITNIDATLLITNVFFTNNLPLSIVYFILNSFLFVSLSAYVDKKEKGFDKYSDYFTESDFMDYIPKIIILSVILKMINAFCLFLFVIMLFKGFYHFVKYKLKSNKLKSKDFLNDQDLNKLKKRKEELIQKIAKDKGSLIALSNLSSTDKHYGNLNSLADKVTKYNMENTNRSELLKHFSSVKRENLDMVND